MNTRFCHHRKVQAISLLLTLIFSLGSRLNSYSYPMAQAAAPGLPFTEDFSDTALRDDSLTNASWFTIEQTLFLAKRQVQINGFETGQMGTNISDDAHSTSSIALGDVDGDFDLDVVVGNVNQPIRLYINNGTLHPFSGVVGRYISNDAYETHSVALGDMDGDGDLDLIAGNNGPNRLYLNNGTSDPFDAVIGTDISGDVFNTSSIELGDLDWDGDLDLVAGNWAQPVRLYLNNGSLHPFDGIFGIDITSDAYHTSSLKLWDVDEDHDLDLVTGNAGQPNRLYLNNGSDKPFAGVIGSNITGDSHQTFSVDMGDVDGDGDLDLVAGNDGPNRLYLNNGTSAPFSGVSGLNIISDNHWTRSIAIIDVDCDGDLDLIAGNYGQKNRQYLNNGTSNPFNGVSGSDISADIHYTTAIALGNMDIDGDLDLVVGNFNAQPNQLYINAGAPELFSGVIGNNISTDAFDTTAMALGDVDGDGDLDLVTGNYYNIHRLYLNNGTSDPFNGVVGSDISSDASATFALALGDMDGDGDLDLVANVGSLNRLYLNNGTSDPFNGVIGSDIGSELTNVSSLVLGDIDSDGDLDLVYGNGYSPPRLFLNNGTADPFNGVSGLDISNDTYRTTSVTLGDVDGDGDLDLVVGNDSQANRLYLNNGTSDPFYNESGRNISIDAHNTRCVVLGDVDGDGNLDVVAGNSHYANRLYMNNGTSDPFNGVSGINVGNNVSWTWVNEVLLSDVEKDGDLDLVVAHLGNPSRLFLNNGSKNPYDDWIDIGNDSYQTTSAELGDMDGDGDLDLVVGNNDKPNRLYLNNPVKDPFRKVLGTDISPDVHATLSVVLEDVDGDGDLDLVAGNKGQTNRLYLNNGTVDPFNSLVGSDISSDVDITYSVALGDMDKDGDLDLVAGNYDQPNRLYLNNGTSDPFSAVIGTNISSDVHSSRSVALGDVDADGDLDVVAGNFGQANRLYLNNGTADPFYGISGTDISSDTLYTTSVVLGDMDSDGDLDLVTGNLGVKRLYHNNGSGDPFSGVSGIDISADNHQTYSIALGDVDRDNDLDLVVGNHHVPIRLFLNNGSSEPFLGVSGIDISDDINSVYSVALGDVDGDGDLDLAAGIFSSYLPDRIYINNGTSDPFYGVGGSDITKDIHTTTSIALGDTNGDGGLDLVVGNYGINRLYKNHAGYIVKGWAGSLRVDTETDNIGEIFFTHSASMPLNTGVTYRLSNNGGAQWFIVQPDRPFIFPTNGTDLRWRAELRSLSPALTPRIEEVKIAISLHVFLPSVLR